MDAICLFMEVRAMVDVMDEFCGAVLGDERLTRRLGLIATALSERPQLSIPAATGCRAEMEAAYRFFDNDNVTPEAIGQPHREATHRRMRDEEVVLLVQDTTEVDLTRPAQQVDGAGPLSSETRLGMFYHPLLAIRPDRVPLGTVWSKRWAREEIVTDESTQEKSHRRKHTPIEQKESLRWVEGVRAARETAQACPQTQCVCLMDSEGDIYELLAEVYQSDSGGDLDLIVRACQDRRLLDHPQPRLYEAVRRAPSSGTRTLAIRARTPVVRGRSVPRAREAKRSARVAEVDIRATTVTLKPPYRPDRTLPELTVNVVLVEERHPPAGEAGLCWVLLTTLPVGTIAEVLPVIDFYGVRWQIEVYFKTLKSGCRIEERYFHTLERLANSLAVYAVIAWKVNYLCHLSRECPELSCEVVFDEEEWKPVSMALRHTDPPPTPPTLNEMIRLIASLGGYVLRPKTEPGTKTLWQGLQRTYDLSLAWQTFGPGTS